jgi:hypothetical protein
MAEPVSSAVSRRRFLYAVAVAAAPVAFFARVRNSLGQDHGTVELDPTPAAGEKLELTPEETAGPFFRPNSPAKNSFRDSGVTGTSVKLTGTVLDRKGKPIPKLTRFLARRCQRRVRLQWISMPRPSVFRFRWKVRVGNRHARFVSGTDTPLPCSAPSGAWSDLVDSALFSGRSAQLDRFAV